MVTIDENKLVQIADKSSTSQDFFDYAAKRERNVREGISRIAQIKEQMKQEGYHPVPRDLVLMFKELESAGIGKLEHGKFKWNVSIKEVGKAASATPTAAPNPKPTGTGEILKRYIKDNGRVSDKTSMVFVFDHNKEAEIKFTENLSKADIDTIYNKLLQKCLK